MKRNTGRKTSAVSQKLRRIPSTAPSARDEGPRLIPLDIRGDDRSKEPSRLEHYLELADTALGLRRMHAEQRK